MKVSVNELRKVTERLYSHIEESLGDEIEVPDLFYWSIPVEGRRDQYEEPKEFTMGQTSDDLEELKRIGSGQREPIGLGLVWLGSVLRELGEDHPV
jgi:hypothetical protein